LPTKKGVRMTDIGQQRLSLARNALPNNESRRRPEQPRVSQSA
jgi:hypothetical protein